MGAERGPPRFPSRAHWGVPVLSTRCPPHPRGVPIFVIEDESHAEQIGEFGTFDDALAEVRRRAEMPWDQPPNAAPCTTWKTCGRKYEIVEYDASQTPWRQLSRTRILEVSAEGPKWEKGPWLDG